MLTTARVPYLSHRFSRIRAAGTTHIVLETSYRADAFRNHFADGRRLGLDLEYVAEGVPLGTGGAIGDVSYRLRRTPVIFNGDILSGVEIDNLVPTHSAAGADATRHRTRMPDPRALGCAVTDGDSRVTAFATYWHGGAGLAGRSGARQQHPFRQRLRIGSDA